MSRSAVLNKHLIDQIFTVFGIQIEHFHVRGQQNTLHFQTAVGKVLVQCGELFVSAHSWFLTDIHADLTCIFDKVNKCEQN